jgi:DNA polymerase-1
MLNLDRRLDAERGRARLLLQVHDELIFECPQDDVSKTVKLVKEEMERAASLRVPLRASIETGARWGDFH